jgi:hypothetical protein
LICYGCGKKIILKWFDIYEKKDVYDVILETSNYTDIQNVAVRDFDARNVVTPIHSIIIKTKDTGRRRVLHYGLQKAIRSGN